MDVAAALKGQYKAGLTMLRQCIERCPEDLWEQGKHPRAYWRIVYHALFYTHLYLMPKEKDFEAWPAHQPQARVLWDDDEEGMPPVETTYTQVELLGYLDHIYSHVDAWVDALDLDSQNSGFSWYPIPKIDHQVVNVRHLGGHVGQLSELLMSRDIDIDWAGKR
ncbi:MAG: hypothetical protein JNM34_05265 [Chthonomonadaceae bacterium]|jgi:hypothetical protein|nr:hypothetical protein [Chthonomonadaceae bacterium]